MAAFLSSLNDSLITFIKDQQLFFVATAASDGRINLSPKGLDSLRIENIHELIWLNYTGSGNETAAHLLSQNRMTMMFCSFRGNPLILRLCGEAEVLHPGDPAWENLISQFKQTAGARNIFRLRIESVQTSCGYAVPEYAYQGQRTRLTDWAESKEPEAIRQYWKDNNSMSIDGLPTGLPEA